MNWKFWRRKSPVKSRAEQFFDVLDDTRVRAGVAAAVPMLVAAAARLRKSTDQEKTP